MSIVTVKDIFKDNLDRCLKCKNFDGCPIVKSIARGCIGFQILKSEVKDEEKETT